MELVKNIFFNTDKLTRNSTVKISYTGKFFQDNSEDVYLHYGFGLLWEDVNEVKMEKTELGFQIEVFLADKETFNFCLKNEMNEWDNNEGINYIFELEEVVTDIVAIEDPNFELRVHEEKSFRNFSKKLKLAVYKLLTSIPKLISGKYKKKNYEEN